ncbi:protein E12 [Proboscivirus elephantidbeta4]|uniref:Protein E12 n=1 Tax=Elephant endotheliotropic herpesvirus 4 TaxID=548914 RepID=A0A0S1TPA5_9BETA|nr:protein E12 [Elephant endotheliotropic herpesvirus 4]ALM25945.1 protein E12 [Elephant endotheliotropic herpesvirus 4]
MEEYVVYLYALIAVTLILTIFMNCRGGNRRPLVSVVDPALVLVTTYYGFQRLIAIKSKINVWVPVGHVSRDAVFCDELMVAYIMLAGVSCIVSIVSLTVKTTEASELFVGLVTSRFVRDVARRVLVYMTLTVYAINMTAFTASLTTDEKLIYHVLYYCFFILFFVLISGVADMMVNFPGEFSWFWMIFASGMMWFHQKHVLINTHDSLNENLITFCVNAYVLTKMLYEFDLEETVRDLLDTGNNNNRVPPRPSVPVAVSGNQRRVGGTADATTNTGSDGEQTKDL